jgi:DUF2934 family protein
MFENRAKLALSSTSLESSRLSETNSSPTKELSMPIHDVTNQPELNERHPDIIVGSRSDEETNELIGQRAYELYQQRGPEGGTELSDWLRAEVEVRELLPRPQSLT